MKFTRNLKRKKKKLNLQCGDVILNLTGMEDLPISEQQELIALIQKMGDKTCLKNIRITKKKKIVFF